MEPSSAPPPPQPPGGTVLLTFHDLMKRWSVSRGTVHRLVKSHQLRATRIGSLVRFRIEDVEHFEGGVKKKAVAPAPVAPPPPIPIVKPPDVPPVERPKPVPPPAPKATARPPKPAPAPRQPRRREKRRPSSFDLSKLKDRLEGDDNHE